MVKKVKKAAPSKPKEKLRESKHALSQPAPKNYNFGNDVKLE